MNRDTVGFMERAPSLDRDGRAAYRVTTDGVDLSTTIVRAVAEVSDSDPLAEGEVLYDVVDPDALDSLFCPGSDGTVRNGRVVFELRGCRVDVRADGEHVVYEPVEDQSEAHTAAQSV